MTCRYCDWTFLRPDDRRAPTYIAGKTGTGKSSLLKNIIKRDLAALANKTEPFLATS